MTIQTDTILPADIRTEIEHALCPNVGQGVGTRAQKTPLQVSEGVEFEIDAEGGVYVGTVPYAGETPIDLEYSDRDIPADGLLYVYVADLDRHKEVTNGDLTSRFAALKYESECFRALSMELESIVEEVFGRGDIRFERYPSDEAGAYFVLPLPP